MQKMLSAIALMMLSIALVSAEDRYQLRKISVGDYLKAIPEIVTAWHAQLPPAYGKISHSPLIDALQLELHDTYTDDAIFAQSFEVLSAAYAGLSSGNYAGYTVENRSAWGTALLEAWLRENPTDLAASDRLDIPGFLNITVHPIDFNHDGHNEFWLDVGFSNFNAYVVLQRDPTRTSGYLVVDTPLRWLNWNIDPYSAVETASEVIYFGDMTGDAVPEWVVFERGSTNFEQCGRLYILSWQADRLVDLMPEAAEFCLPDAFVIENLDADAALELTQNDEESDNWGCDWRITHRLKWDGTRFVRLEAQTSFPNTLGCALRQAEPLMWDNRVAEAIPLYEAGIAMGWDNQSEHVPEYMLDSYAELKRYAQARLALAYALNGQMSASRALLTTLSAETSTSGLIDGMIIAMYDADSPLAMCVAAYNLWAAFKINALDDPRQTIMISVGINTITLPRSSPNPPPDPAKAGCSAPSLIDALLANQTFTTDESPSEQLATRGIAALDTFVADFNLDGTDEWLVWLEARGDPVLFVAQADVYLISRPAIRRPNAYTQFGLQPTPDQAIRFLVDYTMVDFAPNNVDYQTYDISSASCQIGRVQGSVRLWRLHDAQLEQFIDSPLCQPKPYSALFNRDGRQLFAAAVTLQGRERYDTRYGDVIYTWNATERTYVPPAPVLLTDPYATATARRLTDAYLFETLDRVIAALRIGDAETALRLLDDTLARYDPTVQPVIINGFHYYRAYTLMALDRQDEALSGYV
ncbi:MAG: hypothetical protein H7Y11_15230, partial [Armatimonadetes bacterium]|nr:hypothetical protein [Anaerolineae bacterium]